MPWRKIQATVLGERVICPQCQVGVGVSKKLRKRPVIWYLEEEQVEGTWGI